MLYNLTKNYNNFINSIGTNIINGPFKGMKYISESVGSCHMPKILGIYENQIYPTLLNFLSNSDLFVDIGAAVSRVPFSIEGTVSIDWHKAPPNLPIAARINGAYCGVSQTIEEGAATTFSIEVLAAAELSACGKPGDQIELLLDGILLTQSFVWGGLNEQLSVIDATIDLVRPVPTELVQQFTFGWNLHTYLGEPDFLDNVLELFPQKWLQIQKWDANARNFLEIPPRDIHKTTIDKFDVF